MSEQKLKKKAKIYIDLNYLGDFLNSYETDIFKIKFIENLNYKLSKRGFEILDVICYAEFDTDKHHWRTQRRLFNMNISTKFQPFYQTAQLNSELVFDITKEIFSTSIAETFIIISDSNHFFKLLKTAINNDKSIIFVDSKKSYGKGFYAHEILAFENIVKLPIEETKKCKKKSIVELANGIDLGAISVTDRQKIARFYDFFINSYFYKKFLETEETKDAVSFNGILNLYHKNNDYLDKEDIKEIIFKAHKNGIIEIYEDKRRGIYCIKNKL